MYRTIMSPASLMAGSSAAGAPGLKSPVLSPVLCCPAVEAVVVVGEAALGVVVGNATSAASDDGGEGQGECTDAATSICTSSLYVSAGRLSSVNAVVSSNASVEELISAVR